MSSLNELGPIPKEHQTWTWLSYIALWVSITVQPSGFVFGAGLLASGLTFYECLLAVTIGNLLLLAPICLNGMAGVKYGIPFPILCKSSFGVSGFRIPTLLRGLVGIGWAGFNIWIGSDAVYNFIVGIRPEAAHSPKLIPNLNLIQFFCFLGFVLVHIGAAFVGVQKLNNLLRFSSWIQGLGMVAMVIWAFCIAPYDKILLASKLLSGSDEKASKALSIMTGITACCSGWSTLTLNIADLSRYSRSERDLIIGQATAFPILNILTPMFGIVIFSAGKIAYPDQISANDWNLTGLFSQWHPVASAMAMFIYALSLFTTNCTANLLSAANDINSLVPYLGFRAAFIVAILMSIAIVPWSTFKSSTGFINDFLVGYSIFTGSILGVMLTDWLWVSQSNLEVNALYDSSSSSGAYYFTRGYNVPAVAAMLIAAVPSVPGYIQEIILGMETTPWTIIYDFTWVISVLLSGLLYIVFLRLCYGRIKRSKYSGSASVPLLPDLTQEDNGGINSSTGLINDAF